MLIAALASLALSHNALALAGELTVGDPAPKPNIEHFVRGSQPEFFAPGKTYVIEFWATWCGPCRASMPHLSDLADKYQDKGVVVVGVSDEKLDTVTGFLNKDEWKQKARYTLATDPDRSTHDAYMQAAAQQGIPTAFIVKDGTVQWIGHPMTMDQPLEEIVAGTWDMKAFKEKFAASQAENRAAMKRSAAMREARKSGDWDSIVTMLDADIAKAEGMAKVQMQMTKFNVLLVEANRPDRAYALGRELVSGNRDNAMLLNAIAWTVVDNPKVKTRDIPFALETAKAAVTASKGKDAAIMDTLARAYWESGDKSMAIETQKKAISIADAASADEMKDTLQKYEGGTPPSPAGGKTAS